MNFVNNVIKKYIQSTPKPTIIVDVNDENDQNVDNFEDALCTTPINTCRKSILLAFDPLMKQSPLTPRRKTKSSSFNMNPQDHIENPADNVVDIIEELLERVISGDFSSAIDSRENFEEQPTPSGDGVPASREIDDPSISSTDNTKEEYSKPTIDNDGSFSTISSSQNVKTDNEDIQHTKTEEEDQEGDKTLSIKSLNITKIDDSDGTNTHANKENQFKDESEYHKEDEPDNNRDNNEKDAENEHQSDFQQANHFSLNDKIEKNDHEEKIELLQKENESLKEEITNLRQQLNVSQQQKTTSEEELHKTLQDLIVIKNEKNEIELNYKQKIDKLMEEHKQVLEEQKRAFNKTLQDADKRGKEAKNDFETMKLLQEYEQTIATRVTEFEKMKKEYETATRHLANLEVAFSDIHQKYERCKTIIEGFKTNEDILKKNLQMANDSIADHQKRYDALKAHAVEQINKSNKQILELKEAYDNEISKLKTLIKRLEIKCHSLQENIELKVKECEELSALCEQVTGKRI